MSKYYKTSKNDMDTHTNDNLAIIPDVHGRSFWQEVLKDDGEAIFLGDYLDPYPWEGITAAEATRILKEIIDLKRTHPDSVTLLLGNHDLGYIDEKICECRMDYRGYKRNRDLLLDNLDLFDIVHAKEMGGVNFLFSHAGIARTWLDAHPELVGKEGFDPLALNRMLHDPQKFKTLFAALSDVSPHRGGLSPVGSPVWADVDEYLNGTPLLEGFFHVFGHSLHAGGAIPVAGGACLDCGQAFRLLDGPLRIAPA